MSSLSESLHTKDIERQLARLRRELAELGGRAGRMGDHLLDDAADVTDAVLRGGAAAARSVQRGARDAGRAIRRDPAPAIALTIAAACLISLAVSRRR